MEETKPTIDLNIKIPVENVLKQYGYIASWRYIQEILKYQYHKLSFEDKKKYRYIYCRIMKYLSNVIKKCDNLDIPCPSPDESIISKLATNLYTFFEYEVSQFVDYIAYNSKSFIYENESDIRQILIAVYDSKILDPFIDDYNKISPCEDIIVTTQTDVERLLHDLKNVR